MNPKGLLLFALVPGLALSLGAGIIEKPPYNVYAALDRSLFQSFEHDAGVYLCSIIKCEPAASSLSESIEYGVVTLRVQEVLRGTNGPELVLPYSCCNPRHIGACEADGPLIWPTLDGIKDRLLCVVVPEGEDPTAPKIPNADGAASWVMTVKDDAAIREMKTICGLYDSKVSPRLAKELKAAVESRLLTLRTFGLEATIMKLGKADPDAALEIVRSRAAGYREIADRIDLEPDPLDEPAVSAYQQNARYADINEAENVLGDIGGGFWRIGPEQKFCTFLCRCLVALSESESPTIRQRAIASLAGNISDYDYRPDLHFRPMDGLSDSEKTRLGAVLNRESSTSDTNLLARIRLIRERLAPLKQ